MKKQRLLDIQTKANNNEAELADCIEILSEFFMSQSQNNKDTKNELVALNNKLDSLNRKMDQIIKIISLEPLAQIMLENLEEEDAEDAE
jgi:hypothetical protein